MKSIDMYYVHPLRSKTNAAIAGLLEQDAETSVGELSSTNGEKLPVWKCSPARYAIITQSAAELGLVFKTLVCPDDSGDCVLLEVVDGKIVTRGDQFPQTPSVPVPDADTVLVRGQRKELGALVRRHLGKLKKV